jgi:filamentous hemagglutinin family protein
MLLRSLAWLGVCGLAWSGIGAAQAQQVVPDGSLNTQVTRSLNDFTITQGTAAGSNLFHSFSEFSIPTGRSATFDLVNTSGISTIFSRVTGGNPSSIDGTLRTLNHTQPVSLFLLNPNGILFGQNARLDLNGSFIATTAKQIQFADGTRFSTTLSATTPLLTVSVPVGLQLGQNPGNITVQGTGHQMSPIVAAIAPLRLNNTPEGLQVGAGKTLALVGGNITLDSGILTAAGGRLDLGAVQPNDPTVPEPTAWVGIRAEGDRWAMDYSTVPQFGDISLRQQAIGNISGTGNGAIQIQARNILLQTGSALVWENRGSQNGTGITIRATDQMRVDRPDSRGFDSGIYAESKALGTLGDTVISAGKFMMQDGGTLIFRTLGSASGSNLTIAADEIQMISRNNRSNTIATRTLGSGNGGSLTIQTQRLNINGAGGIVSTVNNASGNGGNLTVNASESIDLISGSNGVPTQALFSASAVGGTGNAGQLTVNTGKLTLQKGSVISSSTFGAGKGGTVTVNASESISIAGIRTDPINGTQRSGIRAAGILASAATRAFFGLPNVVTGTAGSVVIHTPQLQVSDQAEISVGHSDRGNAGNLLIHADRIILDYQGKIVANTASGEGGNIQLTVKELLSLRHQGFISTEAGGSGNGGNIDLKAPIILGLENSDIFANAIRGRGGNIDITTQGIIGLQYRPKLTVENDITASSEFGVNGSVQVNNVGVDPNSGLSELPTELVDASQQVASQCAAKTGSRFVLTGRGGILQDPTQASQTYHPWQDLRPVAAEKPAGTIAQPPKTEPALLEATGLQVDDYGAIALITSPQHPTSSLYTATCGSTPVARG